MPVSSDFIQVKYLLIFYHILSLHKKKNLKHFRRDKLFVLTDFFFLQWIKIIAVCVLSFGPSLLVYHQDFVYDDGVAIVRNADVTNTNQSILHNVQSILIHDFWGQNLTNEHSHKSFRPMVTLMFHLEFRFFNQTHLPAHMKRVNLLLHIAICCVIYDILRRIFKDIDHSIISIATLLFAAHPIHTEVICSVVGRADLMCTFFFLVTFSHFLDVVEGSEFGFNYLFFFCSPVNNQWLSL